jgi:hypothetical protein
MKKGETEEMFFSRCIFNADSAEAFVVASQ